MVSWGEVTAFTAQNTHMGSLLPPTTHGHSHLAISGALSLAKRHLWNNNHYLSSVVGKRFQTTCQNLFAEIKGTTTCQAEYIYTENITFMSFVYSQLESFQKEFLPSKTWYGFVVEILDGQLERQAYRKGNKVECILLHFALCFPAGQCTADSNTSHCSVCKSRSRFKTFTACNSDLKTDGSSLEKAVRGKEKK